MKNPSFEQGWTDDGNSQIPYHWNWSFRDDDTYTRPEMRVIPKRLVPPDEWELFFLDGEQCVKCFNGANPIRFILWQEIDNLVPGGKYRLTMPVHLDVFIWDKVNKKKVWPDEYAAEVRIAVNGEWEDWCAPAYGNLEYGTYRDVVSEFVVGEDGVVVVELECKAKYSISNNFFLDHFKLELVEAPQCTPRIPYDRTYVLMDQGASLQEWMDAITRHYPYKRTIGGSADDAFYGPNLGSRKVIAVNPSDPEGLREFGEMYYPGAEFEVEGRDALWQRDPRWKDIKLSGDACDSTIGQTGCFITCVAEALRFYQIDLGANPVTVDSALGEEGYTGCNARWSAIDSELGLVVSKPTNINNGLGEGKCGMAEVRIAGQQHFVFVSGKDGDRYRMSDPWTGQRGWLDEGYNDVVSWRLMELVEQPVTNHTLVTGHISGKLGDMEHYLKTAKPRGIKMIAWDVRTVYNWHPGIEAIILRKWYNNSPPNHYFLDAQDKAKAAREYVDLVLGELPQEAQWLWDRGWRGRIGLESLNEPYCNLCEDNRKARDFEIQFCHELMSRGIPLVVPACMNAGVGNPHHDGETEEILVPLARVLDQYNGFFCVHNYSPVDHRVSHLEDQWIWYTGRADWWLPVFKQHGIEVDLFFTEGGAIYGPPPLYQPQPNDGWKSSKCYDGDWPATRSFLVRLNELLNEKYGDRCYGNAIFATGESNQWDSFEVGMREWDDLAGCI